MEKKLNKAERIKEKERVSNAITTKMAIVFVMLVAGIVILIRSGEYTVPSLLTLNIARVVTLVCAAAAAVWYFKAKQGSEARALVGSAIFWLGIAAAALFATLMYPYFGAFRLVLSLLAFALCFFVYEVYPLNFTVCTAEIVAGCILASVIDNAGFRGYNLVANISALVLAAAAAVLGILYARTLGKSKAALPVYIGGAVALLTVLCTLLFAHTLYFVAAACVVFVIVAIIFTVKLM